MFKLQEAEEVLTPGPAGRFREIPTGGQAAPIYTTVGMRYGELTVEAQLSKAEHDKGGNNRWLCRCDCGGAAIRTTAALNWAARKGTIQSCRECRVQLYHGKKATQHFWVDFFIEHKTMWPRSSCLALERQIGEDLQAQGHRPPEEVFEVAPETLGSWEPSNKCRRQQRIALLYPLSKEGYVWECIECKRLQPRGFGCLEYGCDEFVCIACVREEKHQHSDLEASSLQSVGKRWGWDRGTLTRESVRKREARALEQLRHPSRAGALLGFVNPEDTPHLQPFVREASAQTRQPRMSLQRACIMSELREGATEADVARRYGVNVAYVRDVNEDMWWAAQLKKKGHP